MAETVREKDEWFSLSRSEEREITPVSLSMTNTGSVSGQEARG